MSSFTLALASSQQILTDVRCKKYWQTFKWLIPSFKAATCLPEALLSRVCSLCRGRLVDVSWYYKKPLFPGNISPLKQAESLANFSLLNFSGSLPWAESWRFSSQKELYPDGQGMATGPAPLEAPNAAFRTSGLAREGIRPLLPFWYISFIICCFVSNSYIPSSFLWAGAGPASDERRRRAPAAAGAGDEQGGGGAGQCPCRFSNLSNFLAGALSALCDVSLALLQVELGGRGHSGRCCSFFFFF